MAWEEVISRSLCQQILLVDDPSRQHLRIFELLTDKGYLVNRVFSVSEAMETIKKKPFDVLLTDLNNNNKDGGTSADIEFIDRIRSIDPHVAIIVMTTSLAKDTAMEALRKGASGYLTHPVRLEKMELIFQRLLHQQRLTREIKVLNEKLSRGDASKEIVCQSEAMIRLRKLVHTMAPLDCNVLITGASGCGKRFIAEIIHSRSRRATGPFLGVNCAALPDRLQDSMLFGFGQWPGKFQAAAGGTILIEEVSEMHPSLQAKVERILTTKRLQPHVGHKGPESARMDVRVLSSTTQDLPSLVIAGRFLESLFLRLSEASIQVPPLKERKEDLPLLAQHFLQEMNIKQGTAFTGISRGAMDLLFSYQWPGNVRELANILERGGSGSKKEVFGVREARKGFRMARAPEAVEKGSIHSLARR